MGLTGVESGITSTTPRMHGGCIHLMQRPHVFLQLQAGPSDSRLEPGCYQPRCCRWDLMRNRALSLSGPGPFHCSSFSRAVHATAATQCRFRDDTSRVASSHAGLSSNFRPDTREWLSYDGPCHVSGAPGVDRVLRGISAMCLKR